MIRGSRSELVVGAVNCVKRVEYQREKRRKSFGGQRVVQRAEVGESQGRKG